MNMMHSTLFSVPSSLCHRLHIQVMLPLFVLLQIYFPAAYAEKENQTAPPPYRHIVIDPPFDPTSYSGQYKDPVNRYDVFSISYNGGQRDAYIYKPTDYGDDPLPVVMLLHGAQRTGAAMVDKWQKLADEYGILLVAPNGANRTWQAGKSDAEFVMTVLKTVQSQHKIDPKRIYLFGHSRGAIFAIYLSAWHPNVFAATSLHAGAVPSETLKPMLTGLPRSYPLLVINGTKDHFFPLPDVRQTVKTLAEGGMEVTFIEISDHNHWHYDIADFINRRAWNFMKMRTMPPANDRTRHIEIIN